MKTKTNALSLPLFEGLERSYRLFLRELVNLLSVWTVCQDEADENESLDERMDTALRVTEILRPLFSCHPLDKDRIEECLFATELFPQKTMDTILFFIDSFERRQPEEDLLFGYLPQEDSIDFSLRWIDVLFRLAFLFQDIQSGLLEYGLDYFRIDEDANGEDLLALAETRSRAELLKELKTMLRAKEEDDDDMKVDKKDLRDLLSKIGKER